MFVLGLECLEEFFSPALFIGAAGGALFTKVATPIGGAAVATAIGPGLIICGMAALSSTVVGTPIAGVLIMLELTMSYELALAAMLCSNKFVGSTFVIRPLIFRQAAIR